MAITVHNISTDGPPPAGDERHVYVGRSGRAAAQYGLQGSQLGNPFRLQGERHRDEAVGQYTAQLVWIMDAPIERLNARGRAMRAELDRLTDLARGGDLHLYCWCAPKLCHAAMIKGVLEHRLSTPAAAAAEPPRVVDVVH